MVVCHCEGVTDREIRRAVRDGALTRRGVARACAAGRTCGGCLPVIDKIIDAEMRRAPATGLSRVGELATTG